MQMKEKFGPASVWPQQRPSSQASQKCILLTSKCQKKEQFLLHFHSKIFILPQLFLWLQKIVLDLIYWIQKKKFDFAHPMTEFLGSMYMHPKSPKMAKLGFQAYFIEYHIKAFLVNLCQHWLGVRFEGLTKGYQPA